jgi:DNA-binding NtrC family response regulator
MREPGVTSPINTEPVKVLSVSPLENDHATLQAILGHSGWKLFTTDCHGEALPMMRQHDIAVVVCEHDLVSGKWTDLLDRLNDLPHPPSLIVTSRLADENLWAEALNLGAWDVLAKPFDRMEVLRTVKTAWQHWHDQTRFRATGVMRAAS